MRDGCPRLGGPRYHPASMRALTFPGLAAIAALASCAFRPSGGAVDDQRGDGGPGDQDSDDAAAATDGPAPIDARPVDAHPAFDASACPADYRAMGNQATRYRIIDGGTWVAAEAACEHDAPGLTHLAVFSDDGERDAVGTALFFSGEFRRTWIGVLNDGTAHTVTGEPLYPAISVGPGQAVSWVRDLFTPFRAEAMSTSYAAACECDGLAATP